MLIGLHDCEYDSMPTFPDFALMKISAFYKSKGNSVNWWLPIDNELYDEIYSSKVLGFTPENEYLPEYAIKGGRGNRAVQQRCVSLMDVLLNPKMLTA